MVLSNTEIEKNIQDGNIFIGETSSEPIPVDQLVFDTTTLNVHLANEFTIWKEFKSGARISVDPGVDGFSFPKYAHDFTEKAVKDRDGFYEIRTNEFLLCRTAEYVRLSKKISARFEGRSSLGRLGIGVHITAPTIHAAFEGTITLVHCKVSFFTSCLSFSSLSHLLLLELAQLVLRRRVWNRKENSCAKSKKINFTVY